MNLRGHISGALILLSTMAFAADEKITLRWNVRPNERFESQLRMTIDAGAMGNVRAILHFAERVVSVTPEKVTASMYVPGVTVTGSGAIEAAADALREIKGLAFERTNDLRGKSVAVLGMQALASGALDLMLPEGAVGVGETWSSKFTPNELVGEVEMTYKLVSFDADVAVIQGEIQATDVVKATDKPYRFVVERATGRYREAEGYLSATVQGIDLKLSFTHKTIFPNKLRRNGA